MEFTFSPVEEAYQSLYEKALASMPAAQFYCLSPYILPYKPEGHVFKITGEVGTLVQITMRPYSSPSPIEASTILRYETDYLLVQLPLGKVIITAVANGERVVLLIAQNHWASYLAGFASQLYEYVDIEATEWRAKLLNCWSPALVEFLLPYASELVNFSALRGLCSRLAITSLVGCTGGQLAIENLASGLVACSPAFRPMQQRLDFIEPAVYPLYSIAHDHAGQELHAWFPNICIDRWLAFSKLYDNLDGYEVIYISEYRVAVRDDKGIVEVHQFELESEDCSLDALLAQRCTEIGCWWRLDVDFGFVFCVYGYDLDSVVETPLTPPPEDDTLYDWVGVKLLGRMDGGFGFDTRIKAGQLEASCVCSDETWTNPAAWLLAMNYSEMDLYCSRGALAFIST